MICEYCGYEIPGNNKFCIHCGKPVVSNKPELDSGWACGSCHAPLTLGDKFCCACGTPVAWDDDQTDPAAAAPVAWGAGPVSESGPAGWPDDDYEDEDTVALGSHSEYEETEAFDPHFGDRGPVSGGGRYGDGGDVSSGGRYGDWDSGADDPGYGERYPEFDNHGFEDDDDTSNIESLIPPEFGGESDAGAPGRGGRYGDDWEPVDPGDLGWKDGVIPNFPSDPGDWTGGEATVPGIRGGVPRGPETVSGIPVRNPVSDAEDYDDVAGPRPKLMGDLTGERKARPAAGYGKPKHFKKPQDL